MKNALIKQYHVIPHYQEQNHSLKIKNIVTHMYTHKNFMNF